MLSVSVSAFPVLPASRVTSMSLMSLSWSSSSVSRGMFFILGAECS